MKIKPNIILKYIFISLIVLFITIYITHKNGYYTYINHEKSVLTSENISKFENDIKDGKEIDITNYLEKDVDYSTKLSSVGLNISNNIGKFVKKSLTKVFKKLNKLIE